ncbi:MAG TPA: NAD(P)H-dependent oxidoreductase, partial [Candidatus Kapabacteria bacterium]|nr:NAD(P)H-dependent oxidoreductase [Candidatus Kapabacteria bacterium]
MSDVKILGIPGSLRKGSYNRSLVRTAQQLLPQGVTMDTFDLVG